MTQFGFLPLLLPSSARIDDAEESQSKPESWYIGRRPGADEGVKHPKTIFVLTPQKRSDQIIAIADEIVKISHKEGLEARSISWPPNMSEVASHSVISLLEIKKSFLSDISSQDFDTLKSLHLGISSMVWATKGDDLLKDAAVGYLRCLKNENPNLDIRYLKVEDRVDRSISSVAGTVMKAAITPSTEREFVEIKGCLSINRWVADEGISRTLVDKESLVTHEHMAIGESSGGLNLVIGNPKLPESFYFDAKTDSTVELIPLRLRLRSELSA